MHAGAFYRAMGLLTTASPCALVLVPLAYVSAIAAITSRCPLFCLYRNVFLFHGLFEIVKAYGAPGYWT